MRKALVTILVCSAVLAGQHSLAWADSCSGGSCGSSYCNPYESSCQCTDPTCNNPADSDCISRAYCCEAFGNIGAR